MDDDARDHRNGRVTGRPCTLRRTSLRRMPTRIRLLLVAAALALCISLPVHATSSLSFQGDGYRLYFEIGHDDAEAVASIKFFAPGDRTGVMLREDLGVQAFDVAARSLVVSYAGSARASAFRLTVRGEEATLEVDGRRVVSSFSWEM